MVEYKQGLSRSLARALWIAGHMPMNPFEIAEARMTFSQRCNFPKLQYWGLIQREDPDSEKGGVWRITWRGVAFLAGDIRLTKYCWTYRGRPQRYEGPEVYIDELTGGTCSRPEWAREAQPHEEDLR